jgi:ribosomal protein S7
MVYVCREEEKSPKGPSLPDPKYNSVLVAKFIASIMRDGKKEYRRVNFLQMRLISSKKRQRASPLKVFEKALDNVQAHDRGQIPAGGRFDLSGAHRDPAVAASRRWPSAG